MRRPAAAMIERILDRSSQAAEIDPAVFGESPMLYERMRVLHQQAAMYKRDTGIDGLYLGFPFLVFQPADATMKTRIAPVLLWPVRIGAQVGGHRFTIAFDTEREEVRLNPALEAFMGRNVGAEMGGGESRGARAVGTARQYPRCLRPSRDRQAARAGAPSGRRRHRAARRGASWCARRCSSTPLSWARRCWRTSGA